MAQPTTPTAGSSPSQHLTPGVAQTPGSVPAMGRSPAGIGSTPAKAGVQTPDTPGAEPVLFDDIEPVLLARLYPEAVAGGMSQARDAAMKAGAEAHEAGLHLVADQQVVPGAPADAPPADKK